MRTGHWLAAAIFLAIGSLSWWAGADGGGPAFHPSSVAKALGPADGAGSLASAWSGPSPFAPLDCTSANGERVRSSACDPGVEKIRVDGMHPVERARIALALIEAGEFDKVSTLAASFNDCWFMQSSSQDSGLPVDQQVQRTCDFRALEQLVEKAAAHSRVAAQRGDYVARDAYVDLLSTSAAVAGYQMELYDPTTSDPSTVDAVQQLRAKIDAASETVVKFVQSLSDPSEYLIDVAVTKSQLLEARRQAVSDLGATSQ